MTAVLLDQIWLNDATNPADSMAFAYLGDSYKIEETLGGRVEGGYASGRTRLWLTEDDDAVFGLSFADVTAAQRAWLRAHRGRVICVRDVRGYKVFGAYFAAPVELSTMPVGSGACIDTSTITVQSVTFGEAV